MDHVITHGHEREKEGRWGPHFRIGKNKKENKENKEKEKKRHVSNGEKKERRKGGEAFPLDQFSG